MFSSAIERLNDRRDAAGDAGADAGFTLIELMVVLLILAILLAIAIPTFLGVTKSANDRAAQSNLNTALINAKAYYQQNGQTYGTGGAAGTVQGVLATQEPSLTFTTGTITTGVGSNSIVSVYVSNDGNGVVLTSWSKSGYCWVLADNTTAITPIAADAAYGGAAGTSNVPITAGTKYGKVAAATSASCGSNQALANTIPYQTTGFPS
jgi:type IV pilus assembly protein PilA